MSVEPGEDSTKAWTKAIPVKSDRMQSQGLVMVVAPVLAALCLRALLILGPGPLAYVAIGISLTFAGLVWALRAATKAAAAMGGMVCLLVIAGAGSVGHSGLYALMTLFVVTFGATRAGRRVKQRAGLAEPRRGRSASQIIANLGVAGIVAGFFPVLLVAALVEATADTVSSEIGQAFGGQPMMLGSFRRVAVGTDGAVTVLGTQAGVLAAAVVALVGWWTMELGGRQGVVALIAGVAGLVFDSVLGATIERRGWLGNDLVNFASTLFAVLVAYVLT